jgi:hypothetical protein
MTKTCDMNIIVPDLPPLPEGYGPDVVWGMALQGGEHVIFDGHRWICRDRPTAITFWHAYKREPVTHVRYLNLYPLGGVSSHTSREEADFPAAQLRVSCRRVEFMEGQFDD